MITKKDNPHVSLLLKISGVFSLLLICAIGITTILSIRSTEDASMEIAKVMGERKLIGDIASFEDQIALQYGYFKLVNGELTDAQENPIQHDYTLVDRVNSHLGVQAIIFVKDGDSFRRISTSLTDGSGNRAVDKYLETDNPAFNPLRAGRDYTGAAVVFGNDYLTTYHPIFARSENGNSREVIGALFLGIEMESIENTIIQKRNQNIIRTILESLVILAAATLITILFARSIIKPIIDVTHTLKDISEGEGDLTRHIEIKSNDEIGDLSRYFNLTLEKIRDMIVKIKNETTKLSNESENLATNMAETASATNEITSNIQSIRERVMCQSESVSQTHATVEQVVENINKLNNDVENQSDNISQASTIIAQLVANTRTVTDTLVNNSANVTTLMESSVIGRSSLSEVSADFQKIAKESEALLKINTIMEDIAAQTSLLSMNAAIEAAHAGESGRGFAVVAGEIRKLAIDSTAQSKTIGTVLTKIKSSIDKITLSTKNVMAKFEDIDSGIKTVADQEDNIRHTMEVQGSESKQVLQGVSAVKEITKGVKSGSHEMFEDAKKIIDESSNLGKITEEITCGMNEMATGVVQINKAIHIVNEISGKNRDGLKVLLKEVSRFKVA